MWEEWKWRLQPKGNSRDISALHIREKYRYKERHDRCLRLEYKTPTSSPNSSKSNAVY